MINILKYDPHLLIHTILRGISYVHIAAVINVLMFCVCVRVRALGPKGNMEG